MASADQPTSVALRVLTYNVWGLPEPVDRSPWRYAEIARQLNAYDVVAIQEAWYSKVKDILAPSHPYRAYGKKPFKLVGGSGLVTLSKYPVTESRFLEFKFCSEFQCPVRNGVLFTRIEIQKGLDIDVYQTHFNALKQNDLIRTAQLLELVGLVQEYSFGRPVIVMGDFNFDFRTDGYHELLGALHLEDSYEEYVQSLPEPSEAQLNGYTFDVIRNAWAASRMSLESHPLRLDYIFYRDQPWFSLKVEESDLRFTETYRDRKPLSDHYAVSTLFTLRLAPR